MFRTFYKSVDISVSCFQMDGNNLSVLFEDTEFGTEANLGGGFTASPDDIFSILEALDGVSDFNPVDEVGMLVSQKFNSSSVFQESETEFEVSPKCKKQKVIATASMEVEIDGQQRISHITVERNRRKQMNEHLTVLRSLMPSFYVKRVSVLSSLLSSSFPLGFKLDSRNTTYQTYNKV